jgi:hypothetical protein
MNEYAEMILIASPLLSLGVLVALAAWLSYRNSKK